MLSAFVTQFSLMSVEAEAEADPRIHLRSLDFFIERETMNSYLAQFIFAIVAVAGYFLGGRSIIIIGVLHCLVDQIVRYNLNFLAKRIKQGEIDFKRLKKIEYIFYAVGFVWSMAGWPLADSLDGLRLLLMVVSVAGILVMANTTCFAPRVFQATVIGYALGMVVATAAMKTMPGYVFGIGVAAFLVVVLGIAVATSRQLIHMLRMQVERDEAIEGQKRTIAALDLARMAATTLAETDNLTGIANRFRFMIELDRLIAGGERFSLTLLDIDLFKNINDSLGHNIGDEVLKAVGKVLATVESGVCVVARLGGDEFALIANLDRNPMSGDKVILAVKSQLESLQNLNLDLPAISITAGSARFPQDAANRSDLLAAADMAQREAKKARRGGHINYSVSLADKFHRETQIAYGIQQAIDSRDVFLCFQPKINLKTGDFDGAEVLSRFSGKSLSGYSLDEIFEVAESRGLGTVLDELVLDLYREALVSLRDEHSILLPTSVNLSGAILKTPERLLAKLNALIADGLSPALVRLEITENAIYGRGQIGVIELLGRIVELGFSLALDDFGTGSGALRHFVSLPVSEIKIDKSFVSGMRSDRRNEAIIRGLIVMGRRMGMDIVAEGVEIEAEASRLRSMGAQFAQGFLWSRPIPLLQFVDFLRQFGPETVRRRAEKPDYGRIRLQAKG